VAGSVEEARDWLRQADRAVQAAEVLRREGFPAEAVARAYYAMFYAAKAALAHEGVALSKHSAVIAAFGRLFAATGRVPRDLHKALVGAFDDRRLADYSPGWEPSDEVARRRIAEAETLIQQVAHLLPSS